MSGIRSAAEELATHIFDMLTDVDFTTDWARLVRLCWWAYRRGAVSGTVVHLYQVGVDYDRDADTLTDTAVATA